jgi:hypothetical protein
MPATCLLFRRHKGRERDKPEELARYVSRPPIASERLALTDSGHVRYALKTPFRDGTTLMIFEPQDFIARLASLVPKPRAHLTLYHGVFAPASALRAQVVPKRQPAAELDDLGAAAQAGVSDRHRDLPAGGSV